MAVQRTMVKQHNGWLLFIAVVFLIRDRSLFLPEGAGRIWGWVMSFLMSWKGAITFLMSWEGGRQFFVLLFLQAVFCA